MKRLSNAPITSEQAVSVVVGALLMVSIMMIAAVQYQNNVIPAQEQQTEFQHNREVRSQLQHLRSNIIATSSSGQIRTTPVNIGTRFEQQFIFGFLPAVQSPNPAGTLETYNVTEQESKQITITGADGRGGASNYWQATSQYNYSTSYLEYTIQYARYQNPPDVYYENTVLYERTGEDNDVVVQSQQTLVQGNNINLITLSGDIGTTTTAEVNVQTQPVSAPAQTVVVRSPNASEGGPLTITIPTNMSSSDWCSLSDAELSNPTQYPACGGDGAGILNDQISDRGGYISGLEMTSNGLKMEFEADETYTLKLSRVHLQTQQDQTVTPRTEARYVAWQGSEQITFRENTRHTITAQVRDKYNNPVEGVGTVATAFESDDENDCVGDFVSGTQGGVTGCPDEQQPGYRTSGENGEVTYFYDTPQVSDDTRINLNIELAKNSTYGSIVAPNIALAGSDTYSAADLGDQSKSKNPTESLSGANGNGILFSHNQESQINNSSTFRVLDASLNKSHAVTGRPVRMSVVLDNTGVTAETAYLQLKSNKSASTTIQPSTFPVTVEPGDQLRYEYTVVFNETGTYNLSISNTGISKQIEIHSKSSTVYDGNIQSAVEDQTISKVITSYKDEINNSDNPAYNPSIPPVVQGSNGTFVNDAEGIVYDFGQAQDSQNGKSLTLEGNQTTDELKVGLAFENVPEQNHYTVQLNYNITTGPNVQMKVVRRDGTTIDPNTKYMLDSNNDQTKTKYFTLSKEESDYIQDHKNIYLVFTANGVPVVDINYMRGISSEKILDTTSASTEFTDFRVENSAGAESSEFNIYEPIYIDVVKQNTGTSVITEEVRIEENGDILDSKTVRYNPGEKKTITFIKYKPEGVYTYSSRNYDATTVTVGNPTANSNKAPIPKMSSTAPEIQNKYVPTGQNVGDDRVASFTLDASDSYDPNGDNITFTWKVDGTQEGTGPTLNESAFDTNGTKTVALIVEDEHGNKSAIRRKVGINDVEPTALFKVNPTPIPAGTTAEFNASNALDQDGTIERYIWEVNGVVVSDKKDDPYALYEFNNTGDYEITLTTVDDDGNRQSRSTTVTVFDADVVADYEYTPTEPKVGEEVSFDGSASQADNATIESYEWTLADGTLIGTGETITKSFSEQGDVSVTLTVETSDGKTANTTRTLTVKPPFEAVANADPENAVPGETIYFDAYSSNDTQNLIENYSWELGNGATASGQETFYEYSEPGTYVVTLTVTGHGYKDTDNVTVNISENEPVAIVQPDNKTSVFLSEDISLYGDDSYHPTATLTYYHWELGNGDTKDTENVIDYNYSEPTVNVESGEITERLKSSYNATLTVTDEYGNTDTNNTFVEVWNRGPVSNWTANVTPTNGDYEIYEGESIKFNGTHSYHEESPEASVQNYNWLVNGTSESTTATFERTWNNAGNYSVDLTVTDEYNASDTNSTTVIVHQQPVARLTATPTTATTSDTIEFNASQSTPGGPTGTTIEEYNWDFNGDGTTDKTTTSSTTTHSYSSSGDYNATVTIVNSDGYKDTDNVSLTIESGTANKTTYIISNPTNKSTTNYQVNITVQKKANMSSDYSSIRFYQDGASLDYHRVNYNSSSALFVVELKEITSTGAVVNMTYGDGLATASDPEATYLAYDYHGNGMDDGQFYGSAYDVNGNYARLTENAGGQQGSLRYGSNDVGLKAQYEWRIAPNTGGGAADSVNFVTFNNGNRYEHEDPNGNGIHFAVNDHDRCVAVNYNGQCQKSTSYSRDTNWHTAHAQVAQVGSSTYSYDFNSGATYASHLTGTISATGVGDNFGFSGRTGGSTNRHEVRSITVRKWLGQEMEVSQLEGNFIDSYERGNLDPYNVSNNNFFYTTTESSHGDFGLAVDTACCGENAYSNSGLNHYPTRGDYWTLDLKYEGDMSWGETYGTKFRIGWGGTGSSPAYQAEINGRTGNLELHQSGTGVVDTAPVSWSSYNGKPLRMHIDYDAYGDGMIRVHLFTQDWTKLATVDTYDPNGPDGGSQLYFYMVGDGNHEGTIYIDKIKTTKPVTYTDDWEDAGLTNWKETSGTWSVSGGTITETSSFNGNSLVNNHIKMDIGNGVTAYYDSNIDDEYANYNILTLRNNDGQQIARGGVGHNDYSGYDGHTGSYLDGEGTRWENRPIYERTWYTIKYSYGGKDTWATTDPGGELRYYGTTPDNDTVAQKIRLTGWSHTSGDDWRNLFIRRHTGSYISFGNNYAYQESFEKYSLGAQAWQVKNDNSNDDIKVSSNYASDGSQSLRSVQPNTGAPSHHHAYTNFGGASSTATKVEYTADIYIDHKENGGSADAFSFKVLDSKHTDVSSYKQAFSINFVSNGNYIRTSGTNLRTDIRNSWIHTRVVVNYDTNEYTVYINGNNEGTFAMDSTGTPDEFDYIVHRNDNYDGYIDNTTVKVLE